MTVEAPPRYIRRMRAGRRSLLSSVVLLTGVGAPLVAQTVRGTVIGTPSGRSIEYGLVQLIDSAGRERVRTVSDEAGRFTLPPAPPGHYRLRVLRIGFQSWVSPPPPFELTAGQTREFRIEMPEVPFVLLGIAVERNNPCRNGPERGAETAALWEEAKKTLAVTQATFARRRYRFRTASFERLLDAAGTVRTSKREPDSELREWPYRSIPAESLSRAGFVQGSTTSALYYGPDIDVLLSEVFLREHCFRVARAKGAAGDTLIGLGFEPARGRRLPDIAGALWIDRRTGELRHIEYRYRNLDTWIPADQTGGRIELQRLETGAWVIRRWWIRTAVPRLRPGGRIELYGFREGGGEVTEVLTADGRSLAVTAPPPSTRPLTQIVHGRVTDVASSDPIQGVTVLLLDEQQAVAARTQTAENGRYELQVPAPGIYSLQFQVPGYAPLALEQLELTAGRTVESSPQLRPLPPVSLDPVVVPGEEVRPFLEDFQRRKTAGAGDFLTREAVERWGTSQTSDLVTRLSGFTMEYDAGGQPIISSRRQAMRRTRCPPLVYVDGHLVGNTETFDMNTFLSVSNIEAVEAYNGAARVPVEFNRDGAQCGVIVFWTRR